MRRRTGEHLDEVVARELASLLRHVERKVSRLERAADDDDEREKGATHRLLGVGEEGGLRVLDAELLLRLHTCERESVRTRTKTKSGTKRTLVPAPLMPDVASASR